MTLKNPDLHRVYEAATKGDLGDDLWCCAHAAETAFEAAREILQVNWKGLRAHPLSCPNMDGAENMIAAVFEELLIENGYQWRDLVEAADRFQ